MNRVHFPLPARFALALAACSASSVMAQVNWSNPPVCPTQIYQMVGGLGTGGGQALTVLNRSTLQWEKYADTSIQAYNGYAYVPELGKAIAGSAPNQATDPTTFGLVNDAGVITPAAAPFSANVATNGNGASAAGGYDEANKFYWFARAYSKNVFYVQDMTQAGVNDWSTFTPAPQAVNFGVANGYPNGLGTPPNAGAAQLTDVVIIGNKAYAVAMNTMFEYTFDVSGRTVTPASYRSVALNTAGNQFPAQGTFGSMWTARTPGGKQVIYTALNLNAFTNTPPTTLAGYPAGSMFRIEEGVTAGTFKSTLEPILSNVANGGDGYNCSSAPALLLLDVADDVNYTPVNTPVTGSWVINDKLAGAKLKNGPSDMIPSNGTVTMTSNITTTDPATGQLVTTGNYTYTPNPGFTGVDSFTYTVCDDFVGEGTQCRTATVTITVSGPEAGQDDVTTTPQNTPIAIPVLNNDVVNNPKLVSATTPANGTTSVNTATGVVTYTPNPGFTGTDTFNYTATDAAGNPYTQLVTVHVGPLTAIDDSYVTKPGVPVNGNAGQNDRYPADSVFTMTGPLSNPAAGTVTGFNPADGTFVFTPAAGFMGTVTFPYQVCQPNGAACANAVVTVVVPGARDDSYVTSPNTPVSNQLGTNDSVPAGATFSATGPLSNPAAGTVVVNAGGTFTFTPANGFAGTVTFPYQACLPVPNSSVCVSAVATIVVPLARNDSYTTLSNMPVSGQLGANDVVPAGSTFSATGPLSDPTAGTVVVNADGTLTFAPANGYSGIVTVPYQACLPAPDQAVCVMAVATIGVAAIRDVPLGAVAVPVNNPLALLMLGGGLTGLMLFVTRQRKRTAAQRLDK